MTFCHSSKPKPKGDWWSMSGFVWTICVWCWRLLWLIPLLWPALITVQLVWWSCTAVTRCGKSVADKYANKDVNLLTDGKLATEGSAALLVLLAGLILQLGEVFGGLIWSQRSAAQARFQDPQREGGGSQSPPAEDTEDDAFHTPPSSPPPFDLLSPSDAGMDDRSQNGDQLGEGDGVMAPTLRERLRNAATAINVMRRIGVSGILYGDKRDSDVPKSHQADLRLGINRSMRAYNLFEEIKKDYHVTLERFPPIAEESPEREAEMQRVHERCAKKCLELARTNGGLYTKAAQFVASLQGGAGDKGIPKAYVDVLRVLTDSAPFHAFDEMNQVLVEEFGVGADELFASFEKEPIAAASLAQVHRAVLKDGMHVAVKILYPSLRKEMASDFAMFRRLGGQMKPGGYDMLWLVEDFESAIRSELDCEHEARNCEIAARLLAGRRGVKFPQVVWDLTRCDVLVMEYVPGLMRLTEPEVLVANGLQLFQCGQLVSDALTELALVHGHVHGDPHAGNIYITTEGAGRLERNASPCVVVLDHGLYHNIDDTLRRDLCALYLACINRNSREISLFALKCAGPLGRFFPLLLSPWFILGSSLSIDDVRAAKDNKLPPSVSAKDVSDAMTSLHVMGGNMLGVLHSFGYVRGLLNAVSFGERRRLKSVARMAVLGLVPPQIAQRALLQGDHVLPLAWRWKLFKATTNVDVMAALLHLLTTATAPQFDVSKSPAPFLHLAAACLEVGRWPSIHRLHSNATDLYFYFRPDEAAAATATSHTDERASGDGDDDATAASREQTQRHTDSSPAAAGVVVLAGERVGAVSLIQKVKSGVSYLRSAPANSTKGSEAVRTAAFTASNDEGGAHCNTEAGSRTHCTNEASSRAPSLTGESIISRADSENEYADSLGSGVAGECSASYQSLSGLGEGNMSAQTSPRDRYSNAGDDETFETFERSNTEPFNVKTAEKR